MKICFVNNLFPPIAGGGTEVVVRTTIDLLLQHGHEVTLITTAPLRTTRRWSKDTGPGFPVYRFHPQNLYYYTEGQKQPVWKKILWHAFDLANPFDKSVLSSILLDIRPDLVHGHNLKGMSYTLPSVCAKLGLPYIHTLHNYQLLHPYGTFLYNQPPPYFSPRILAWLYQAINKRLFRPTALVLAPSNYVLSMHVQAGFFKTTEKLVLPSGVDLPTDVPRVPTPNQPLRIVYLGALEPIKGIQQLIAGFKGLPRHAAVLDIYGTGSLQAEVAEKIAGLDNIKLCGHLKDRDRLGSYDVLIFPSICFETQGLVVLEAMSYGLTVIASDIGGPKEVIRHGENGLLVQAGNVEALTRGIMDLANDRMKLANLQSQARAAVKKYSLVNYASQLLSLYRGVITKVTSIEPPSILNR